MTFLINAIKLAKTKAAEVMPLGWHTGTSIGSVVGQLRAVDDTDGNREFVIMPPTGSEKISCVFSDDMRDDMQKYLFKTVKVSGKMSYQKISPFPEIVYAEDIAEYPKIQKKKSFKEMRGMFSNYDKPQNN